MLSNEIIRAKNRIVYLRQQRVIARMAGSSTEKIDGEIMGIEWALRKRLIKGQPEAHLPDAREEKLAVSIR